jgi:dihydroorotate dehydrogenase electron transfer subunit
MFLAEELRGHGHRIDYILGGRTQDHILRPIEAKRVSLTVTFTTDDGSTGHQGVVTDVLAERIQTTGARVVYACGPVPMLRAVARVCAQAKVPCQVAWEEVMACGFGACLACAVPVRIENEEGWGWARCCTEGPVFSSSRLHWERVEAAPVPAAPMGSGTARPSRRSPRRGRVVPSSPSTSAPVCGSPAPSSPPPGVSTTAKSSRRIWT